MGRLLQPPLGLNTLHVGAMDDFPWFSGSQLAWPVNDVASGMPGDPAFIWPVNEAAGVTGTATPTAATAVKEGQLASFPKDVSPNLPML